MISKLFRRELSPETGLFAEAQALLDDGLDLDFVLALYPDDEEWLAPLLTTTTSLAESYAAEEPSYYFEASLKSRFLAAAQAAHGHAPEAPTAPAHAVHAGGGMVARLQTTMAAAVVVLALGLVGVATLGFVTADNALPGDWNYAFKRASEHLEYTLSRGDERVNVQVRQTQVRVEEFRRQVEQGKVTAESVERLRETLEDTQRLAQQKPLDELQAASVRAIGEAAGEVLTGVAETQPDLAEVVQDALPVAAGLGEVTPLDPVKPTATPEPTPDPANDGEDGETPDPDPGEPGETETATPDTSASATPEPSASAEPGGDPAP